MIRYTTVTTGVGLSVVFTKYVCSRVVVVAVRLTPEQRAALREMWECKYKTLPRSHALSMMRHHEAGFMGRGPSAVAAQAERILGRAQNPAYLEEEQRAAALAAPPPPPADESGYTPPAGLSAAQSQLLRDLAKRYAKLPPASVKQVMDRYVGMVKSRDDAGCAALRTALKLPAAPAAPAAASSAPAASPATAAPPSAAAAPAPPPPGPYTPPASLAGPKAQLLREIAVKYKALPEQALTMMMRQYEASFARLDDTGLAQMRLALGLPDAPRVGAATTATAAVVAAPAPAPTDRPSGAVAAAQPAAAVAATSSAASGPSASGEQPQGVAKRCPQGCPPYEDSSSSESSDDDGDATGRRRARPAPVFCGECGSKLV